MNKPDPDAQEYHDTQAEKELDAIDGAVPYLVNCLGEYCKKHAIDTNRGNMIHFIKLLEEAALELLYKRRNELMKITGWRTEKPSLTIDKPYNASKFTDAYINNSDDFKQGALQMIDFITGHPDIFDDAKDSVRSVFVDDVLRFARKPVPNQAMKNAPLMSAVMRDESGEA